MSPVQQISYILLSKFLSEYCVCRRVSICKWCWTSKREAGANYGMVAYGNASKEWFEQADAFNALCVGKTASEIAALCASDNYGTDAVKTAGCTILVNGLTKAAAKIA